jgi:hypothetical protein
MLAERKDLGQLRASEAGTGSESPHPTSVILSGSRWSRKISAKRFSPRRDYLRMRQYYVWLRSEDRALIESLNPQWSDLRKVQGSIASRRSLDFARDDGGEVFPLNPENRPREQRRREIIEEDAEADLDLAPTKTAAIFKMIFPAHPSRPSCPRSYGAQALRASHRPIVASRPEPFCRQGRLRRCSRSSKHCGELTPYACSRML